MTRAGQQQALRTMLECQAATQAWPSDHLLSAVHTVGLSPQFDRDGSVDEMLRSISTLC